MKAKNNIPRKREQPKPLPAPFNEQNWEKLLPYQKNSYFLAEARLKMQGVEGTGYLDAICWLHYRAAALCDIVSEAAYSESRSKMPGESLSVVMGIIREDIEVAGVLARKMPQDQRESASGAAA